MKPLFLSICLKDDNFANTSIKVKDGLIGVEQSIKLCYLDVPGADWWTLPGEMRLSEQKQEVNR